MATRHYTRPEIDKALSGDFLERDSKRFVYQRKDGRLNWEETIAPGEGYSAFLTERSSYLLADRELMRTAYGYAQGILQTLNLPTSPALSFEGGDNSYFDGRKVHVSTKALDDRSLNVTRRLDVILGLTLHEGLHAEHTDMRKYRAHLGGKVRNGIEGSLVNVVEDERIEHICGDEYAGLANYLKATKYYFFEKFTRDEAQRNEQKDEVCRLVNAILAVIRYPSTLSDEDKYAFGDYLVPIREVLEKEFPKDIEGSFRLAARIYDIIEDIVKRKQEEKKQEKKQQDGGGKEGHEGAGGGSKRKNDGGQDGDGKGSGGDGSKQGSDGKGSKDGQKSGRDDKGSSDGKSGSGGSESGAGGSKGGNGAGGGEMSADEVMKKMEEALKRYSEIEKTRGEVNLTDEAGCVASLGNDADDYCNGKMDDGEEGMMFVRTDKNSCYENSYQASLDRIRRYIPANRNILEATSMSRTMTVRGTRSGKLDTAKLAEACQGVQTIYTRSWDEPAKDVCVCVLVDESGSMNGEKERVARDLAVLLNEALGNIENVDLSIYGYTTGKLFTRREDGFINRWACGAIGARGGTPTRQAIISAHRRVHKMSDIEDCLMFVISDGQAQGGNQAVRRAVNEVKREGTSIVGISIDKALSACDLREMYDNYIVVDDLSTLARDLSVTVKKAVLSHNR